MERPNNPNETKYLLIGEEEFERLLRSYYILGKGLLAFEYLCGLSRGRVRSARHYARRVGRAPPETTDQGESFPAADDVQPLRSGTPRRTSRAP